MTIYGGYGGGEVKYWIRIQQMSANSFKLGMKDNQEFERMISAKWDCYCEGVV